MSVLAKFKEIINKPDIKLISQIEVSEEEYQLLLSYTRAKVKNIVIQQFARADVYLSITMVQVAIRNYTEGNYWNYFIDEIGFDIPTAKRSQLGKAFIATLREYALFEVAHDVGSNYAYVENIKAHSFVPNSYINGYLDFVFSFYDRNLSRYIDSNIEEELSDMIDFMGTTLSDKTDKIRLDKFEDNAPKSYKLLKATRQVIAQGPTYVIVEQIANHLHMIDDYYYDDKYASSSDRFSLAFNNWVKEKESEINKGLLEKRKRNQSKYFKKPHFEIDRTNNLAYLVIPEQKIRNDEFNGSAKVTVLHNGHSNSVKLTMYSAYGTLVSEPVKMLIPDLFGEYEVTISSSRDRSFNIPAKDVRIFDEEFNEVNKLPGGHAYLLVKKGSEVKSDEAFIYANHGLPNWDEYSYGNIDDNTVIYVNGQAYSMLGNFADKIEFNYVTDEYTVSANGYPVQCVYRHPDLSFKVEAININAAFIWCNGRKINISECADAIINLPNDNTFLGVMLNIQKYIPEEDGYFSIYLDEPGKAKRQLCNYVLIAHLRCFTDRFRYIYSEYAEVAIRGNYDLKPNNCEMVSDGLFRINLNDSTQMLLDLDLKGITYTLHINLPTFKYGFERNWQIKKLDMLWHTELRNDFYVHMPNATQAKIGINHQKGKYVHGEVIGTNDFRFDITSLVQEIQDSKRPFNYIDLYFYDVKWRSLPIYRVLNQLWLNSFIFGKDGSEVFIDVSYEGKSNLKIKVYEHGSDNLVLEDYLEQGRNVLPQLNEHSLYRIEQYESIQDDFFGEETLIPIKKPLYKVGVVNYDDLSNCKMIINQINFEDNALELDYVYTLYGLKKIDEVTYIGSLHGRSKVAKTRVMIPKDSCSLISGCVPSNMHEKKTYYPSYYVGQEVEITLSKENNKLYVSNIELIDEGSKDCLCYDKEQKKLISWNDDCLYDSNDVKRFKYLENDLLHLDVIFRRVE